MEKKKIQSKDFFFLLYYTASAPHAKPDDKEEDEEEEVPLEQLLRVSAAQELGNSKSTRQLTENICIK